MCIHVHGVKVKKERKRLVVGEGEDSGGLIWSMHMSGDEVMKTSTFYNQCMLIKNDLTGESKSE